MITLLTLWLPHFLKNLWKTFSKTLLRSLNELEPLRTLSSHPQFPSGIFFQCNSERNLIKQRWRIFTSWGKENNVNAVQLMLRISVVLSQLWTMKVGVYMCRMGKRESSPLWEPQALGKLELLGSKICISIFYSAAWHSPTTTTTSELS